MTVQERAEKYADKFINGQEFGRTNAREALIAAYLAGAAQTASYETPGYPDDFDQRRELYLAADPRTRDRL